VTGLAVVKARDRLTVLLAAVTAACAIVLLVLLDAHGIAMLGGLVIGVLVGAVSPPGIVSAPAARAGGYQGCRTGPAAAGDATPRWQGRPG
jgi:hypothetical protein